MTPSLGGRPFAVGRVLGNRRWWDENDLRSSYAGPAAHLRGGGSRMSVRHPAEREREVQATLERLRERREQRGDEGGFTLIELLIVVVILGILAAIVVFAVQNLTGSAAKSSCGADYKTVETAAEAYKAQEGVVAPNMTALTTQAADGNGP